MPKKNGKNAFMFFVMDFKRKQENRGVRFRGGMPEVTAAASDSWTKMTPQEKGPYEKMAKDAKVTNTYNNAGERYTAQGVAFSVIDKESNDLKKAEDDMKKHVSQIVTSSYLDNTIATQEYFFIACNYFCKTTDGFYIPAELAIIKYNLEVGKLNVYHTYINPGKIPTGYANDTRLHSIAKHRLPSPPNAKGSQDYANILREICKFICVDNVFPPFFTNDDQIKPIKSIIEQLCMDADADPSVFKVYPLSQLLFVLKGKAVEYDIDNTADDGFKSIHIAQAMIDHDRWDHCEIACEFHETEDVSKYCALSYVTRWAFIFSDHICHNLKIKLVAGVHLPVNADVSVGEALKYDLDETNSTYSFADDVSVASSHYSKAAAMEHAPESVLSASTYNDERRGNDYPAMNARHASSSSSSTASQGPSNRHGQQYKWEDVGKHDPDADDDDDDDDEMNPWTSQSRKSRKPPAGSAHFNPQRGLGRGSFINDDFPSMSTRGGRGRGTRGRF